MDKNILIEPELQIGQEFWIFYNGRVTLGLVAGYHVHVTSCLNKKESWHTQLFRRWFNKNNQNDYVYIFNYDVKIENEIRSYQVEKIKNDWYFNKKYKMFFSKELLYEIRNF